MESRKAQLSVETMIIYGMVILVTLSVIGGLLYFNILDLGSYLPDRCDIGGTGDLKCEEMKFSSIEGVLELGIRNIGQKPVAELTVEVTDDEGVHFDTVGPESATVDGSPIAPDNALSPGSIALVTLSVTDAEQGRLLRGTVITRYKFKDGVVVQDAVGNIRLKAS